MKSFIMIAGIMVHIALPVCSQEPGFIDLEGFWEIVPVQNDSWEDAVLPGIDAPWIRSYQPSSWWFDDEEESDNNSRYREAPGIWARRVFELSESHLEMDAVFHWEIIRFGFEAYINGTSIGRQDYYCPGTLNIPKGLLKPGRNELVIKTMGWKSLPKGGLNNLPFFPIGASRFSWGSKGSGSILGEVKIEFYNSIRIRSVLMEPGPDENRVTAHVTLDPLYPVNNDLVLEIGIKDGDNVRKWFASSRITPQQISAKRIAVVIPMKNFEPWSIENPVTYVADITLKQESGLDKKSVRFGMRTFESRDGGFWMNGEPIKILGSNMVGEWKWTPYYYHNRGDSLRKYLIQDARGMNVNAVRTHTLPPNHSTANLCDTAGMMLLAEMPMTYNFQPLNFFEDGARKYHDRAVKIARAWVEELGNHPSIIMWVSTNEPISDEYFDQSDWDLNVLIPAMKELDPTRPVMRSGAFSPDVYDLHCYSGWWEGIPGDYDYTIKKLADFDNGSVPIMNSEFIAFDNTGPYRWLGIEEGYPEKWTLFEAEEAGLKQTEILRRLDYDAVLPYMMHGWTKGNWREYAPSPMYAAMKSALSPVAVSLNLNDQNYIAGTGKNVNVWLINDQNTGVHTNLEIFSCPYNPEFATGNRYYQNAEKIFSREYALPARSRKEVEVDIQLPVDTGSHWLAALLDTGEGSRVMSQRKIKIVEDPELPRTIASRKYHFVGNDMESAKWVAQRKINATIGIPIYKGIMSGGGKDYEVSADADMLVVWENISYNIDNLRIADLINRYLLAGKKVLIMRQRDWKMSDWHFQPFLKKGINIEYSTRPDRSSTMFRDKHGMGSEIWNGLNKDDFLHWNGLGNAMCLEALSSLPDISQPVYRMSPEGVEPLDDHAVIIDNEDVITSNFPVDYHDPYFTRKSGAEISQRNFPLLRGSMASLLCTTKDPEGFYEASYEFSIKDPINGILWVFEQGREWSSPFDWSVDKGPWNNAPVTISMENSSKIGAVGEFGPLFAWSKLGTISLAPGQHLLNIRINKPKHNGQYLLSQDCFFIVPQGNAGEFLAYSGNRNPLLARVRVGTGELIISQVLIADRLCKSSKIYDPFAEKFFMNLLAY